MVQSTGEKQLTPEMLGSMSDADLLRVLSEGQIKDQKLALHFVSEFRRRMDEQLYHQKRDPKGYKFHAAECWEIAEGYKYYDAQWAQLLAGVGNEDAALDRRQVAESWGELADLFIQSVQ